MRRVECNLVAVANQLVDRRRRQISEVPGIPEIQVNVVDNDEPADGGLGGSRGWCHYGGGNGEHPERVLHNPLDSRARQPALTAAAARSPAAIMAKGVFQHVFRSVMQAAACACLCLAAALAQAPPPIDIPFTFETRQPIVAVRVNGSDPLPFVVDTGASVHVIDRAVVERAMRRTPTAPSREMSGGGEGTVRAQTIEGLSLTAAGATWDDQPAVAVALGYPKDKHFAGLIGAPILRRYVVRFSFERRMLTLIEPASYTPPPTAVPIPFELQDDLPTVRATIDAGKGPIEAGLMVDTGASQFIDLNRPFVDAHGLVEAMPDAAAAERPAGIGSPTPFLYGTGRRVVFGSRTFDRPRLGLSRATSGSSSRAGRDGIIGNDLLRRFIVTIDYQRRVIVLEDPPR